MIYKHFPNERSICLPKTKNTHPLPQTLQTTVLFNTRSKVNKRFLIIFIKKLFKRSKFLLKILGENFSKKENCGKIN